MRIEAKTTLGNLIRMVWHVPRCVRLRKVAWVDDETAQWAQWTPNGLVHHLVVHQASRIVFDARSMVVLIDPVDDDPPAELSDRRDGRMDAPTGVQHGQEVATVVLAVDRASALRPARAARRVERAVPRRVGGLMRVASMLSALALAQGLRVATVDIVLWRACAVGLLDSRTGAIA